MSDLSAAPRTDTQPDAWRQIAMQPALAELVFFPSRYLNSSWRAQFFPQALGEQVWSCAAAHGHLSEHLKQVVPLLDFATPSLEHRAWTIALMPADQLSRLVMYIGIVVLGTEIRSAVSRVEIQTILQQIGADLYDFAIQRAALIYAQRAVTSSSSSAPAVDFSNIGMRIRQAGHDLLRRFISECDPALWARTQLKLEYQTPNEVPPCAVIITDAAMRRILPRVVREVD